MSFQSGQQFPGFDQIIEATKSVGFPIVAFILIVLAVVAPLYALLRYVIVDAVRYFTNRLDQITRQSDAAYDRLGDHISRSNDRLVEAIDRQSAQISRQTEQIALSREQGARNNEALQITLQFLSHTQQEITAHRATVEPAVESQLSSLASAHIPSPPVTGDKEDR